MSLLLCFIFPLFIFARRLVGSSLLAGILIHPADTGSESKASRLTVLSLGEMAMSEPGPPSPEAGTLCTTFGRRRTELKCRDPDTSMNQGCQTSPSSPGWALSSRSGEKRPERGIRWLEGTACCPGWGHGGTPSVFLIPPTDVGLPLRLGQGRAMWPDDTSRPCGAAQPCC